MGQIIFLKSKLASDVIRDDKHMYKLWVNLMAEMRKEKGAQIVMDNEINFKKSKERIMRSLRYNNFNPMRNTLYQPCSKEHKRKRIMKEVLETRAVTNFIYNHEYVVIDKEQA